MLPWYYNCFCSLNKLQRWVNSRRPPSMLAISERLFIVVKARSDKFLSITDSDKLWVDRQISWKVSRHKPFNFSLPLLLLTTVHIFFFSNISGFVFKRPILDKYEGFILENVNELKFTKKTAKEKAATMSLIEQSFLHLLCITNLHSDDCQCYVKEFLWIDHMLLTTFYILGIIL